MSTLPFLLSVADELDNIHSQSYMDDFGLGFHPHRQYYRTPTIQLSLPASTDWMQERHSRYRSSRYYVDTTQNNLQSTAEEEVDEEEREAARKAARAIMQGTAVGADDIADVDEDEDANSRSAAVAAAADAASNNLGASTSSAAAAAAVAMAAAKASSLNSNSSKGKGKSGTGGKKGKSGEDEDDENIDRTVRMYNLSKKCCKNYYRHALETGGPGAAKGREVKCTESTHSSSEESLQKFASPIEFLTCFLVKKSRTPKCSATCVGGSKKS